MRERGLRVKMDFVFIVLGKSILFESTLFYMFQDSRIFPFKFSLTVGYRVCRRGRTAPTSRKFFSGKKVRSSEKKPTVAVVAPSGGAKGGFIVVVVFVSLISIVYKSIMAFPLKFFSLHFKSLLIIIIYFSHSLFRLYCLFVSSQLVTKGVREKERAGRKV